MTSFVVTCEDPTPENGQVTPSESIYMPNDTVDFSCNTGYNLNGCNRSTCQSTGDWKPHTPTCTPGKPPHGHLYLQ